MKSTLTLTCSCVMLTLAVADTASPAKDAPKEVDAPTEAVAVVMPTKGHEARGVVRLKQQGDTVHIVGEIRGLSPGKHGFHIHQYGDLRAADGKSAGGHYNPRGHKHGAPSDAEHHAGDLGNIMAGEDGVAKINIKSDAFELHYVIGRAIVVHAGADDLTSQPSGDAGARAGIGVIGFANVDEAKPAKEKR